LRYKLPNKLYHTEATLWDHSKRVCDGATGGSPELMAAALLHDVGKSVAEVYDSSGQRHYYGHEIIGTAQAAYILDTMGMPDAFIEKACKLIRFHATVLTKPNEKMVLQRAKDVHPATLDELLLLVAADLDPDLTTDKECDILTEWCKIAEKLDVLLGYSEEKMVKHTQEPFLQGRHLIALGLKPGKWFGDILEAATEAQRKDEFDSLNGAIEWAATFVKEAYGIDVFPDADEGNAG